MRAAASGLLCAIAGLACVSYAAAGCLSFVDTSQLPKCYKQGTFLCLGEYDKACQLGENQLVMSVVDQGRDRRRNEQQVGIKFENEGAAESAIETVWVEDEYMLLKGLSHMQPLITSPGMRYKLLPNSTVFADALAHHVPFDQHFVASCADPRKQGTGIIRGLRRQSVDESPCVSNSGAVNRHDSLTMVFDTKCTVEEVEQAMALGLIRVGVQVGGFTTKGPKRKSFATCHDIIEVEAYVPDSHDMHGPDAFDFEEDEFWEEDDEEDFHPGLPHGMDTAAASH